MKRKVVLMTKIFNSTSLHNLINFHIIFHTHETRQPSPYTDEAKECTTLESWLDSCQNSPGAQLVPYSVGTMCAFPWSKVFGVWSWPLTPIQWKQLLRNNFTFHYIYITLKTVEIKLINLSELAYQVTELDARAISKKFNNKCAW